MMFLEKPWLFHPRWIKKRGSVAKELFAKNLYPLLATGAPWNWDRY